MVVNISHFVNRLMLRNSTGTPYACAGQSIISKVFKCIPRQNFDFSYFLFATNDIITAASRKTVRISPIDYIYLGLTVYGHLATRKTRHQ